MAPPYRDGAVEKTVVVETESRRLLVVVIAAGILGVVGAALFAGLHHPMVWMMTGLFVLGGAAGTHTLRLEVDRSNGLLRWSHRFLGVALKRGQCPLAQIRDVVVVVERVVQGESGPFEAHAIYVRRASVGEQEWIRIVGQGSTMEDVQLDLARRIRVAAGLRTDLPLVIRAEGL